MIKARKRQEWPFGIDRPAERSRVVAAMCWSELNAVAPDRAERLRAFFEQLGESYYLAPSWTTVQPGQALTRAQVAEQAHVTTQAVAMWVSRGIVRGKARHTLTARPDGLYDPSEVDAFLRLYNAPPKPTTPG